MNQIIQCPDCSMVLRPLTEDMPYLQCPACHNSFLNLCHMIPTRIFEPSRCLVCKNVYHTIKCFQCSHLLIFRQYRMGSNFICKCGSKGCYLVCRYCQCIHCLPSDRRYQGVKIECKSCKKNFCFITCNKCLSSIYKDKFEKGQKYTCNDCKMVNYWEECARCHFEFGSDKKKEICEACHYLQQEQAKQKVNLTQQQQLIYPNEISSENLCKVCLSKQANFIHDKCFHLSTCEECSKRLNGECPLCRQKGQFHRVFK